MEKHSKKVQPIDGLQEKQYIKRSVMDRRSFLGRRVLNLGPVYPGKERRIKKNRRQGWEDRVEWQPANQWNNFSSTLYFKSSSQP